MPITAPALSSTRAATPLRAGPWSLLYENGYIRGITIGSAEAVRRIYFSVRDELWNFIEGEVSDLKLAANNDSFSISFSCRNRRNAADFRWHAEIAGTDSGEISFSVTGQALATFRQKRIGFCVLNPLSCKGTPCSIGQDDGRSIESAFPTDIAPQTVFTRMRSMRYRFAEGSAVVISFEGELFETEDQRNWTDASFKTYAPLQLTDAPQVIEKGTIIRQKVTLRPEGSFADLVTRAVPAPKPTIDLAKDSPPLTLPAIGFLDTPGGLAYRADHLLQILAPSHMRVDLRFHEQPVESEAGKAIAGFRLHGIPLECAAIFTNDYQSEADRLAQALSASEIRVDRFLIYHRNGPASLGPVIAPVCLALSKKFPEAQLCFGTDGYFVELNRARPASEADGGICYSATPQVHTFDEAAIMENIPGLSETLKTCASFAAGKSVSISPLTLRPRKKPELPAKDGGPDERQPTLFTAAWLLGSLVSCMQGSVATVTLGEVAGPGGVMALDGGSVYPCWLVLAGLGLVAEKLVKCSGPESSPVTWIAGERLVIAANTTGKPQQVSVAGLADHCTCSILDDDSFRAIKGEDDPLSALRKKGVEARGGNTEVELAPYGLAFFFAQ